MVGTPVPEAAVNKYGELGSREDDIGANRPTLGSNLNWVVDSKAKTKGKKRGTNSPLGSGVAPAIAPHRGAHRRAGSRGRSRQPFDLLNLAGATNGATYPTVFQPISA